MKKWTITIYADIIYREIRISFLIFYYTAKVC